MELHFKRQPQVRAGNYKICNSYLMLGLIYMDLRKYKKNQAFHQMIDRFKLFPYQLILSAQSQKLRFRDYFPKWITRLYKPT